MYREHTVGVVVPAYDEAAFVDTVVETMPSFVDRTYVVDDCSIDDTWQVIRRTAAACNDDAAADDGADVDTDSEPKPVRADGMRVEPPVEAGDLPGGGDVTDARSVVPIRHEENRGVGGAIATGYRAALADGVDVVAVMGSDGQMDPDHLSHLLDPIVEGRGDYAKGNRLVEPSFRESMPAWRLFGNWLLTFLTKIASGYWQTMDPQNGYTAISRSALDAVDLDAMYDGYGYCNDLLVRLNVADASVVDVSLPAVYGDEESSIDYPEYVRTVSTMLLRDFLWRLRVEYLVRNFHPLALLYVVGAVVVGLGLSGVAGVLERWVGDEPALVPALLTVQVTATGVLGLLLAMRFDRQANESLESRVDGPGDDESV